VPFLLCIKKAIGALTPMAPGIKHSLSYFFFLLDFFVAAFFFAAFFFAIFRPPCN